jgi:signal transduction histidine kinase
VTSQVGRGSMQIDGQVIAKAAEAVSRGGSLETVARPFLELLHRITGLDSSYLTEVRWTEDEQEILFSNNRGDLKILEGLVVPWEDTLCRRALESGQRCTSDVPGMWPESEAARELGITTYVSVPVVDRTDAVLGTLCGASGGSVDVSAEALDIMDMFARLIADQWQRDKEHADAEQRASHAEQRLKERVMFLAEAEHKLKSPLTILRGWTDLLSEGWREFDDETRAKAFATLRNAVSQATTQVEEMLDEARAEVLVSQLTIRPVGVAPMLTRVAEELRCATSKHQVRVDATGDARVIVDEQALWQILWHLGENALKYSPNGGTISLGWHQTDDMTVMTVADEGLGVPQDIDLFEPFSRSSTVDFRDIPGSGLGLHVVRNLVQAMHGSVKAERREVRGSIFSVSLPKG